MQRLNTEEVEALVAQAGSDPLTVAVNGINLSLAHHAAWTEERFEKIGERFDSVDHVLSRIDIRCEAIDKRFETTDVRLAKMDARAVEATKSLEYLELAQRNSRTRLNDIDMIQVAMLGRLDGLETGQAKLEAGQARLEAGHTDLKSGQARLETGQAELKASFADLQAGQGIIVDEMRALTARITSVLNFAVKGELKVHEIDE